MNTALYDKLPSKVEPTEEKPFSLFDSGIDVWICHKESSDGQICIFYRPECPDDDYDTDQRIGYKHARILGHIILRYLNKHSKAIEAELKKEIEESEAEYL